MDGPYSAELWNGPKDLEGSNCIAKSEHLSRDDAASALFELKDHHVFGDDWHFACVEGPEGRSHIKLRRVIGFDIGYGFDAYAETMRIDAEDLPLPSYGP